MIANSGMILLHMHAHLQEELWCAISCSDHILAGQPTHEPENPIGKFHPVPELQRVPSDF
jgi:hypothetical protein